MCDISFTDNLQCRPFSLQIKYTLQRGYGEVSLISAIKADLISCGLLILFLGRGRLLWMGMEGS